MRNPSMAISTTYHVYEEGKSISYDIHPSGDFPDVVELRQLFDRKEESRITINHDQLPDVILALVKYMIDERIDDKLAIKNLLSDIPRKF